MKASLLNIVIVGGILPLLLTACSSNLPDAVTDNKTTQASSVTPATTTVLPTVTTPVTAVVPLALTTTNASPGVNTSIALIASGGTPGYTFTLIAGSGILTGATYITPGMGETASFQVADATGAIATLNVAVTGPTMTQISRYVVNGSSFFTGTNDGYTNGVSASGPSYKVLQNSSGDSTTKALYRCVIPNSSSFFESAQSNCEGNWNNATLGYVYTTQVAGTVALYRYTGGNCGGDHIDDTNPNDSLVSGCRQEGPIGFVPAP